METLFTTGNITFVLGLIAIMFSVYSYFRTPQVDSEKKDALLAQQVQWEKESTAARFEEMTKMIGATTTMAQNHIHTVDTKVDALIGTVNALSNSVTRLETVINERIPRKI